MGKARVELMASPRGHALLAYDQDGRIVSDETFGTMGDRHKRATAIAARLGAPILYARKGRA